MEFRLKRHDGEYRWISDNGVPRIASDGVFEGYIGACIDIHERIIYEKKLKEEEERLNIIIDASGLGTWEFNIQEYKPLYSTQYMKIMGYDRYIPLSQEQLSKHIHPDDHHIITEGYEKALKTGALSYETRIIWNDGSTHWIDARGKVFYDKDKNPLKIIGTIRDISEEKYYQQELVDREQKFRLLADSMPQFIWTGNAEGQLTYFNQSVYQYSGLTEEEIEKNGWLQIVHPDEQEENIKQWINAIKTGKGFLFEHRFRRYDGEYRWQLSRAIPQRDVNGTIQMWVGTSTDIQDQKIFTYELEKEVHQRTLELKQKNEDLEKMNKELEAFAYISSHDLQEPLRKIQTFSSRILEKEYANLSDSGKDNFQRMENASKRMQTLINDLLTYSRTKTTEKKFEKTDLNKIVEAVKEDLKEELLQKKAIIMSDDLCEINIIPFQFRQLLYNLISNSLKFSNKKDPPIIKIKSEIVNGVNLHVEKISKELSYCHISVADNGIGFEPQYSEKIFEVFQRLHGTGEYKGTGIGLAIVKTIVENHQGIIIAKGEVNMGSTFDMYIPIDEKEN